MGKKENKNIVFNNENEKEKYISFLWKKYNEIKVHSSRDILDIFKEKCHMNEDAYDFYSTLMLLLGFGYMFIVGVNLDWKSLLVDIPKKLFTIFTSVEACLALADDNIAFIKIITSLLSTPFILVGNIAKYMEKRRIKKNIHKTNNAKVISNKQSIDKPIDSIEISLMKIRNDKKAYEAYLNKENPLKKAIKMIIQAKWRALSITDEVEKNRNLVRINKVCDLLVNSLDLTGKRLEDAIEFTHEQLSVIEEKMQVEITSEAKNAAMLEAHLLNDQNVILNTKIKK